MEVALKNGCDVSAVQPLNPPLNWDLPPTSPVCVFGSCFGSL